VLHFPLIYKKEKSKSPFDAPGITFTASTQDILDAVNESRTDLFIDINTEKPRVECNAQYSTVG
jgi:hypothetical protein